MESDWTMDFNHVKSDTIGWPFSVQPIAAQYWRGRDGKMARFLNKNTFCYEYPVHNTKYIHFYYVLLFRCTAWQFWAPSLRSGTRARPGSRQSYATPRPCTGKLSRLTLHRSTNHADHAKEEYYTEVQIMQIMRKSICKGKFSRITLYRSSDQEDHM